MDFEKLLTLPSFSIGAFDENKTLVSQPGRYRIIGDLKDEDGIYLLVREKDSDDASDRVMGVVEPIEGTMQQKIEQSDALIISEDIDGLLFICIIDYKRIIVDRDDQQN